MTDDRMSSDSPPLVSLNCLKLNKTPACVLLYGAEKPIVMTSVPERLVCDLSLMWFLSICNVCVHVRARTPCGVKNITCICIKNETRGNDTIFAVMDAAGCFDELFSFWSVWVWASWAFEVIQSTRNTTLGVVPLWGGGVMWDVSWHEKELPISSEVFHSSRHRRGSKITSFKLFRTKKKPHVTFCPFIVTMMGNLHPCISYIIVVTSVWAMRSPVNKQFPQEWVAEPLLVN